MLVTDRTIKKKHVAKRVWIVRRYNSITIKHRRWVEWLVLLLCTACVSPIVYYALFSGGQIDFWGGIILSIIFLLPVAIVAFGLMPWGWRLTLSSDDASCVFHRTYFGIPFHAVEVSLMDGGIGPSRVRVQWEVRPESRSFLPVYIAVFILGPLGVLLGAIAHSTQKKVTASNDYPGIIHYNESTDTVKVLLVLEKPAVQQRVLAALHEHAPDWVSVE